MQVQKINSEHKIQQDIIKALSQYRIVLRMQVGRFKTIDNRWIDVGTKGCPDLLYLGNNGQTTWIEVKTSSGRLSVEQLSFHMHLRNMGHKVGVARSVEDALNIADIPNLFT